MKSTIVIFVFILAGTPFLRVKAQPEPLVKQPAYAFTGDSSIKIINHYTEINSVKELLSLFSGKPVFTDLWASWCEPCLEQFTFSEKLYPVLKKRGLKCYIFLLIKRKVKQNGG